MPLKPLHIAIAIGIAASLHFGATSFAFPAFASVPPNHPGQMAALENAEQEQRSRQQQEARERAAVVRAPAVQAATVAAAEVPELPEESPCFGIERVVLEVPPQLPAHVRQLGASTLPMDPFAFARQWLQAYRGQCVGQKGVALLVKGVSQAILARGLVTTRVLVPAQDLSTGTLELALIPGVIGQIRFADPDVWGTWRSAFPTGAGELLNLRDLEQGLEQMKRVSSQDVEMQVVPTSTPGVSDVVIGVKRNRPWTVVASLDNSGSHATGIWQGNLSVGIDNPLGLNDVFHVGYYQDVAFRNKAHGTRGWNGSYSVPWGYWTATLSAYGSNYYQQIAGINTTFVSSGESQNVDLKLHRVLRRSQNDVFGAQVRLTRRFGRSFIEDTEIPQQHRNNTIIELGVTDRHDFGEARFDATLSFRQGIGAFGAQADTVAAGDGPTWRFRMAVLDANLSVPFRIAGQRFRYVTAFRGQFTHDRLYYIDDLTIGSRYTVRGFDGESQLAGQRGFYWRNELQVPFGGRGPFRDGHTLYAGLDYGRVHRLSAARLVGRRPGAQLAGAVVGMRGGLGSRLGGVSYDLSVGVPVYKPKAFHTAGVTSAVQLIYQY